MKIKKWQSLMPPHTPDECEIRHVQPYQAIKEYTCPFCNATIQKGLGHKVVVPVSQADDRRHFHSGCWNKYLSSFNNSQNN